MEINLWYSASLKVLKYIIAQKIYTLPPPLSLSLSLFLFLSLSFSLSFPFLLGGAGCFGRGSFPPPHWMKPWWPLTALIQACSGSFMCLNYSYKRVNNFIWHVSKYSLVKMEIAFELCSTKGYVLNFGVHYYNRETSYNSLPQRQYRGLHDQSSW